MRDAIQQRVELWVPGFVVAALVAVVVLGQAGHASAALGGWYSATFVAVAGLAVIPMTRLVAGRPMPALAFAAATASAASGAIHLAVVEEHLDEWWAFGVFFALLGFLQLGWATAAVTAPDRFLLWLGVTGNAAVALLWVVTRTAGLPFGPGSGEPEAAGLADVAATAFELAVVVTCVALLAETRRPSGAQRLRGRLAASTLLVLATGLTAGALAGGSDHGHDDDHGDEHAHHHS